MPPSFQNPFTKKKREAQERERQAIEAQTRAIKQLQEQSKAVVRQAGNAAQPNGNVRPASGTRPRVPSTSGKPLSVLELLSQGQDNLQRLRGLPSTNLEAFPLVNVLTRITQQLRDAIQKMTPEEAEVWLFQLQEMEEEIRQQTERIMAGAVAALPAASENPPAAHRSAPPSTAASKAAPVTPTRSFLQRLGRSQPQPQAKTQPQSQAAVPARAARPRRTGTYQPPVLATQPPQQPDMPSRQHTGPRQNPIHGTQAQSGGAPAIVAAVPVRPPTQIAQHPQQQQQPPLQSQKAQLASSLMGLPSQPTAPAGPQQPVVHLPAQGDPATRSQAAVPQPRQSVDLFSGLEVKAAGQERTSAPANTTQPHSGDTNTNLLLQSPEKPPLQLTALSPWLQQQRPGSVSHSPPPTAAPQPASRSVQEISLAGMGAGAGGLGEDSHSQQRMGSASSSMAGQLGSTSPSVLSDSGQLATRTASLMGRGVSYTLAHRASQSSSLASATSGAWSAAMTAAAAAAAAAEAGVQVEDMGVKKAIKKKMTRHKVGYGVSEDDEPVEVSIMIPGQPMPGPQFHAAYLTQQQQQAQAQQQQRQQQQPAQQQSKQQAMPPAQQQLDESDPQVQQLIAQRRAYLMQLAQQQQQQSGQAAQDGTWTVPHSTSSQQSPTRSSSTELTGRQSSFTLKGLSPGKPAPGALTLPATQQGAQQQTLQPQQPKAQPSGGVSGDTPAPFHISSKDPVKDLSVYLDQLTGPVQACQHAATVAAAQMVQTLAEAAKQVAAQQSAANQQCQALLQRWCQGHSEVSALEAAQSQAVQREEFEEAERLDAQVQVVSAQRNQLEEGLRRLRAHSAALNSKHSTLQAMQADACSLVADYLQRLHANHSQLLRHMDSQAQADVDKAAADQRSVSSSIEEARVALAQRKVEVAMALEEGDARVRAATATLQRDRSQAAAACEQIQAEIAQLRAQLSQREAALAQAQLALRRVEDQIQGAASQLLAQQQQLHMQQQQLTAQEQALEARAAQAQALAASTAERHVSHTSQRHALSSQGDALRDAAQKLRDSAERMAASVAADRAVVEVREGLTPAVERAQAHLQELITQMRECEAHLANHDAQSSKIQARIAQLQQAINTGIASIQPSEAAKDAAAARKDYREAAKLHAAIKATAQQLEQLQQQLQQAQHAASQHAANGQSARTRVAALRQEEPHVRREAAKAQYDLLLGTAHAQRKRLQEGGLTPDVAEVLQQEVELGVTEAKQLALTWGFIDTGSGTPAPQAQHTLAALSTSPTHLRGQGSPSAATMSEQCAAEQGAGAGVDGDAVATATSADGSHHAVTPSSRALSHANSLGDTMGMQAASSPQAASVDSVPTELPALSSTGSTGSSGQGQSLSQPHAASSPLSSTAPSMLMSEPRSSGQEQGGEQADAAQVHAGREQWHSNGLFEGLQVAGEGQSTGGASQGPGEASGVPVKAGGKLPTSASTDELL